MLRAPDPVPQIGVSSCLGKCQKSSPGAGRQPFSGKSFYLDLPAGKSLQFLTEAIQHLGGVIEGFLSKEVSYIVSSRREAKAERSVASHRGCPSSSEVRVEASFMAHPKGSHARPSQKPTDSVPMSRGKELLQEAIRKQGSSSRSGSGSHSSLLTSARSWGVRVLHVDEMMLRVQQMSLGSSSVKKHAARQPKGTRPGVESRTRKVARLKAPFLKVEDVSRKFRPFHHQFKSFPEISFLGPKDASPFEALMTPGSAHQARGLKTREPSLESAVHTMPRRKGHCECCQETFEELQEHLQSARHQSFARDARPYAEVDRLIAQLSCTFVGLSSQASLPRQSDPPAPECDPLCPETLPPRQPSHPRVASPRMQKDDGDQVLGAPEKDGTVDGMKAPVEPTGTGEVPGPVASHQEPGGSVAVSADPPGTSVSRSLTCQCLLASSGFQDLSSGPDLAPVGHKRKVESSSGSAEKRPSVAWPQASVFVSKAPGPCSTRTAGSRRGLPLPLLGRDLRALSSLPPLRHQLTCLSLPDPLPQQLTDRPAEFWAAQPPRPGRGWPPESEGSGCAAPARGSQQADQLPSCPTAPGPLTTHQHSAAGDPAGSQAASLPGPGPARVGASCSQWFWAPQPLPVPCLPVPQIQAPPSAVRELLL